MKVFVSSTVYDLIDMRAEIADLLRSCGIAPVLSDDKLSDFSVKPDKNSIETCLVNVDACDEMIVILDQRYGPRLGSFGFDDVAATHLEYRRFLKTKRQVHFFVRDRLDGDYAIWKKNGKKADLDYAWVGKKDVALFDFLEERRTLTADKDKPNWFTPFTTSSDLKAALTKYYDDAFLPHRLADAIYRNDFPLFHVTTESDQIQNSFAANVSVDATNNGSATAFNVAFYFGDEKDKKGDLRHLVTPHQTISRVFQVHDVRHATASILHLEYDTGLGIKVIEEYKVGTQRTMGGFVTICRPHSERRFVRVPKPTVTIADE